MFAIKLKNLRTGFGLSQDQLAAKLGTSKSSISYYENGVRLPDGEILIKMAKHFNVSTDFLLGLTEDENYERDEDDQEVEYYARTALNHTKNRKELKQFLNTFSTTIGFISDDSANELLLLESLADITNNHNNTTIFYESRFEYLEELIYGLVKKGVSKPIVMATAIAYIERNENEFEKILSSVSNNFISVRKNIEQSLYDKFREIYANIYKDELTKEVYSNYKYFSPNGPEDFYEDDKEPEIELVNLDELLKEPGNQNDSK